MSSVFEDMVKECMTIVLVKETDISKLMVYGKSINEEKNKENKNAIRRPKQVTLFSLSKGQIMKIIPSCS